MPPPSPSRLAGLLGALLLAVSPAAAATPCGSPEECLAVATALIGSNGGEPTPEQRALAVPPAEAACAGGLPGGCHYAGVLLADGVGVTQDLPRGLDFLERACTAGLLAACHNAGILLLERMPSPETAPQAVQHYKRACVLALDEERRQKVAPRSLRSRYCADFTQAARVLQVGQPGHLELARALRHEASRLPLEASLSYHDRQDLEVSTGLVICWSIAAVGVDVAAPACLDLARHVREDAEGPSADRRWPELPASLPDQLEAEMCTRGSLEGCAVVAKGLARAHRSTPNHAAATTELARLCQADNQTACLELAAWYGRCDPARPVVGEAFDCDPANARTTWAARCQAGQANTCHLSNSLDRLTTRRERLASDQQSCLAGTLAACTDVADTMPWGPERVATLAAGCANGNETGCHLLALALSDGEGVPADLTRAHDVIRELCWPERAYGCVDLCARLPAACEGP